MHETQSPAANVAGPDLAQRLARQFPEVTAEEIADHVGDTSAIPDGDPERSTGEQTALDRLAERLADQFPELGADEIVDTIKGHYHDFDRSKVRDFVPVLVERAVRADIEHPATPQHRNRA